MRADADGDEHLRPDGPIRVPRIARLLVLGKRSANHTLARWKTTCWKVLRDDCSTGGWQPVVKKKLREVAVFQGGQPFEYVLEVGPGIAAVQLGRLDQAQHNPGTNAGLLRTCRCLWTCRAGCCERPLSSGAGNGRRCGKGKHGPWPRSGDQNRTSPDRPRRPFDQQTERQQWAQSRRECQHHVPSRPRTPTYVCTTTCASRSRWASAAPLSTAAAW